MTWIAGVDEAGRGPLAGPVVAAAVILDPHRAIDGLADSKVLSAPRREQLAAEIHAHARAVVIAEADTDEIERLNILHASMAAMARAVAGLRPKPVRVLVDGNRLPPDLAVEAVCVVGGDALEPAISAASIVAKVHRDRLMTTLAEQYPGYGFERHKGYGTRAHLEALERLGPCPAHRRGFKPVRQLTLCFDR